MVSACLPGERRSDGCQRRERQPCYQWCKSALSRHSAKPEGTRRAATACAPPSSPTPRETCSRSEVLQRKQRPPASADISTRLITRILRPPPQQHAHPRHATADTRNASGVGGRAHRVMRNASGSGGRSHPLPGRVRAGRGWVGQGWGGAVHPTSCGGL